MRNVSRAIRFFALGTIAALPALGASSVWAKGDGGARDVRAAAMGVRVGEDDSGAVFAVGDAGIEAESAEVAGRRWIEAAGESLGVSADDLSLVRQAQLGASGGTAVSYRQSLGGLPVEYSYVRLLTRGGERSRVVFATASVARLPKRGFAPVRIGADRAIASVRFRPGFSHLIDWSAPELVVFAGEDGLSRTAARRAWKFTGTFPDLADFDARTFFVDAATGRLLHDRTEVFGGAGTCTGGEVLGFATPGVSAPLPGAPVALTPLPNAFLFYRNESLAATTDRDGAYGDVTLPGGLLTGLDSRLEGSWVRVDDVAGPNLELSADLGEPLCPIFEHGDPGADEFVTAQVNAFLHANLTHDFFRDRAPGLDEIDEQLQAFVNLPETCNAFFTTVGPSINFFAAGSGCTNSAYSSIVAHEYGHFIVNKLGLRQGAFGEGFSDVVAMLLYNDPRIGRDFFGPSTFVRDLSSADASYPCSDGVHYCGQTLGSTWFDIRRNLERSLGIPVGKELSSQLFVDWAQMTSGGRRSNSAHPQTALEVLTVDDDDGDLLNGTPHSEEICDAFAEQNIGCPYGCEAVRAIFPRCSFRNGQYDIAALAYTTRLPGDEVEFLLDVDERQTDRVSRFGFVRARFRDVGEGKHWVCIGGCGDLCEPVICEP